MLELLVKGLLLWAYDLILECVSFIGDVLLDVFRMDTAYFKEHAPVVVELQHIFIGTGWALLLGNLVFQSLRSIVSGIGIDAEDPKFLFCKSALFSFLLLASPQICQIGLDLTSNIIAFMKLPDSVVIASLDEGLFDFSAGWLLAIICGLILLFQVFKLFFEIGERYVVVCILTFFAPLAFAMGGSKSTEDIFKSWCRMFASMCFVSVTNIFFLKVIFSAMSKVPNTVTLIPWVIFISGLCKVARRIDDIVCLLGLNAAHTGRERLYPGYLLANIVRSAAAAATKTARTQWSQAQSFQGKGFHPPYAPNERDHGSAMHSRSAYVSKATEKAAEGKADQMPPNGNFVSQTDKSGHGTTHTAGTRPHTQAGPPSRPFPAARGNIDILADDESLASVKQARPSTPPQKKNNGAAMPQKDRPTPSTPQHKGLSAISPDTQTTDSNLPQGTMQQSAAGATRPPLHRPAEIPGRQDRMDQNSRGTEENETPTGTEPRKNSVNEARYPHRKENPSLPLSPPERASNTMRHPSNGSDTLSGNSRKSDVHMQDSYSEVNAVRQNDLSLGKSKQMNWSAKSVSENACESTSQKNMTRASERFDGAETSEKIQKRRSSPTRAPHSDRKPPAAGRNPNGKSRK